MDAPRIILFSNPLVSTWVLDDTHRILFDAGDGVSAMLDSRIHRIRLAAITHTHRDHCAGLMQLLNLRGGAGDFTTVYPEGSGSGRVLAGFLSQFDSRSTSKVNWAPMAPGAMLPIEPERHFLRAFETDHYPPVPGARARSLGYQIVRHVDKLKPEFRDLAQDALDAIRLEKGRAHLVETVEDVLLSITGDTMPLHPAVYHGSRVLLHECTFLEVAEAREMARYGHPHSCLRDALAIAREAQVGRLGLYHVSRRYDDDHIRARVRQECARMRIACPVSVAFPGRLHEDLFSQSVWEGT